MTAIPPDRTELLETSLIETAIEAWKFSRTFARAVNRLDIGEQPRYASQLRYFQKRVGEQLESCGLKIVNVEGQLFEPGLAASAVNIADFGANDALLVEQMLEPIVMGDNGLKRAGIVVLRKAHL